MMFFCTKLGFLFVVLSSLLSVVQIADSFTLNMMSLTLEKAKKSQQSILFVTNKMCPFAQKAWIALEAADVPYKLEQVSLYGSGGKPDWFWKLNPKGQVPILVIDSDNVIADSDQILDEMSMLIDIAHTHSSLSEYSTTSGLLIVDDYDSNNKQQQYATKINIFRSKLNEFLPIGKDAVLGGDRQLMWTKLKELDNLMEGQPYIVGKKPTIADCAAFPFLWRINEEFSGRKASKLCWTENDCHNIPVWLDYCSKQPPFANSIQSSWWWWW